jgi:hypothetical protein
MMVPTWLVWSVQPPECLEKISCSSMLDAGRAWAERQFRKGMLARDGTELLVACEGDAMPRHSMYRVKITIVNAPAFRASFQGLAFEGTNGDPSKGGGRG